MKQITNKEYEEREYGILFFHTDNMDSYDSNHAVIEI